MTAHKAAATVVLSYFKNGAFIAPLGVKIPVILSRLLTLPRNGFTSEAN